MAYDASSSKRNRSRSFVENEHPKTEDASRESADERHRRRLYLAIMGLCVGLIVVAWTVVRLFSAPAAIGMSVVAMVLPPIAAIVANAGRG